MDKNKALDVQGKKEVEAKKESTIPLKRYSPATDIIETKDELQIYMDMPGVDKENVNVKLEKNVLGIEGKIYPDTYNDLNPVYTEYNIGHFQRQFELSNDIDQEKIEAKIDNGVLTLILPKVPEQKPKLIQVN